MSGRAVLLSAILSLLLAATPLYANEPVALNNHAVDLQAQGNHEKALEQLQQAYGMYPYEPTIKRNLAEAYTIIGERQLSRNEYDNAAASFDKARELFPDNPRYYLLRGVALYLGKYYDAALNEFERARGLGGDGVDLYYYLGRIHYDTGNLSAALENWDKALALNPDYHGVRQLADKARRELAVEGQMARGFSSRFVISYDGDGTSHLAGEILDTLEDAYNRVGSDLSHFPTARIPVILYTRKDYRTVTAGPDWSGGLYDGKIRLPVGGAESLTPLLQGVLFHEYAHAVVSELAHGNCPTWLNEGIAEVAGRSRFNQPLLELARAARQSTFLPFARLEGNFTGFNSKEAALAYQQSYSMVDFMVKAYGWYKVKELLVNLGSGMKLEAAMKRTFTDFGLDYSGVVQEWQSSVVKEMADYEGGSGGSRQH